MWLRDTEWNWNWNWMKCECVHVTLSVSDSATVPLKFIFMYILSIIQKPIVLYLEQFNCWKIPTALAKSIKYISVFVCRYRSSNIERWKCCRRHRCGAFLAIGGWGVRLFRLIACVDVNGCNIIYSLLLASSLWAMCMNLSLSASVSVSACSTWKLVCVHRKPKKDDKLSHTYRFWLKWKKRDENITRHENLVASSWHPIHDVAHVSNWDKSVQQQQRWKLCILMASQWWETRFQLFRRDLKSLEPLDSVTCESCLTLTLTHAHKANRWNEIKSELHWPR